MVVQILDNLGQFLSQQNGAWASYKATSDEIELDSVMRLGKSISWYFPKVSGQSMDFYSQNVGFEKGYMGILEPKANYDFQISLKNLQGILVPGLGYDFSGHRMGKGKGFYDRALKNFNGIKVGITFDELIVQSLPADPWDVPMDYLISESGLKKIK